MTKLRSKIIELYDYRDIELKDIAEPFSMTEDELAAKIDRIRKKHAVQTDADCVQKEDFVTLSCRSDTAKFNKENLVLRVGAGLFHGEFEEKIIGMAPGDEREITVDGADVRVSIIGIKRRELSVLTDEVVAGYGIDGVRTVDELKKHIYHSKKQQYIEENAEGIASYISDQAAARSKVELDDEEVEFLRADGREFADYMIKASGLSEDAADEEFVEKTGQKKEDFINALVSITVDGIFGTLVGMQMMEEDGIEPTDGQYEQALAEFAENMNCTKEEAKSRFPYRKFEMQQASNYYFEKIVEYVENYLDKE